MMSGQEVNRLIMALSADNEDPYAQIVDGNTWLRAKSGELVTAPEELSFDYQNRTIRRRADAGEDFAKIIGGAAPPGSGNTVLADVRGFTSEQWRTIQAVARVMAKEKVLFDEKAWAKALEVLNQGQDGAGLLAAKDSDDLSTAQTKVLEQALDDLRNAASSEAPTAVQPEPVVAGA